MRKLRDTEFLFESVLEVLGELLQHLAVVDIADSADVGPGLKVVPEAQWCPGWECRAI